MGLPLSLPGLQASWAVLSVTSSTVTESGGLGGPGSITGTDTEAQMRLQDVDVTVCARKYCKKNRSSEYICTKTHRAEI